MAKRGRPKGSGKKKGRPPKVAPAAAPPEEELPGEVLDEIADLAGRSSDDPNIDSPDDGPLPDADLPPLDEAPADVPVEAVDADEVAADATDADADDTAEPEPAKQVVAADLMKIIGPQLSTMCAAGQVGAQAGLLRGAAWGLRKIGPLRDVTALRRIQENAPWKLPDAPGTLPGMPREILIEGYRAAFEMASLSDKPMSPAMAILLGSLGAAVIQVIIAINIPEPVPVQQNAAAA